MPEEKPVADTHETQPEKNPLLCANCQLVPPLPDSPTKLCADCKEKFIRFPIPKWLYIFLALILCLMVISLSRMPKFFGTAMHVHRAEKAITEHKYKTAITEIDKVLEQYPEHIQANAILLIASSGSLDMVRMQQAFAALEGKNVEDQDLFNRMNEAADKVKRYFPEDTAVYYTIERFKTDSVMVLTRFMDTLLKTREVETPCMYMLADKFYDLKAYKECSSILKTILIKNPDNITALHLLAAADRNSGKYDEAFLLCDHLLELNREDVSAVCQKVKLELKRHQDAKAAVYLEQARQMDDQTLYYAEAKALYLFLTGKKAESLKTLNEIKLMEPDTEKIIFNRTSRIINNSEKFR